MWKNLTEPSNLKPDYPRPHRKAATTPSIASSSRVNGTQETSRATHGNGVAMAMDAKFVKMPLHLSESKFPVSRRLECMRAVPSIPPNYRAKLTALDHAGSIITKQRARKIRESQESRINVDGSSGNCLALRLADSKSDVAELALRNLLNPQSDFGTGAPILKSLQFGTFRGRESPSVSKPEILNSKEASRKSTPSLSTSKQTIKSDSTIQNSNDSSADWESKNLNLRYMLEIWQNAEGVLIDPKLLDLIAINPKITLDSTEGSMGNLKVTLTGAATSKVNLLRKGGTSTLSSPKSSNSSINAFHINSRLGDVLRRPLLSRTSSNMAKLHIEPTVDVPLRRDQPHTNQVTLSAETFAQLIKLSQPNRDDAKSSGGSVLEEALLGTHIYVTEPILVYSNVTDEQPTSIPKRIPKSKLGITEMSKVFNQLLKDNFQGLQQVVRGEPDFKLNLPEISVGTGYPREMPITLSLQKYEFKDDAIHVPYFSGPAVIEDLKKIFGTRHAKDYLKIGSGSGIFKESGSLSVRNFVSIVMANFSGLQKMSLLQGEAGDQWAIFLESRASKLSKMPSKDSLEYINLSNILQKALQQDTVEELRFEACLLLIQPDLHLNLDRRQLTQFKKTTQDIFERGSKAQIDAVCQYRADNNIAGGQEILHVADRLGHQDEEKRVNAIRFFDTLSLHNADSVISTLLRLVSHICWSVRFDVFAVMKIWILKMVPFSSTNRVAKHVLDASHEDYIEYQIEAMKNNPGIDLISEQDHISILKYDHLISECVTSLLDHMWSDSHKVVQDKAIEILGDLHYGMSIYKRIISSLEDPLLSRKTLAIQSIGALGAISQPDLPFFLACFRYPYTSIRIEACKAACQLRSDEAGIVTCLLDLMNDRDANVRCYAMKALGLCGCKLSKNVETINFSISYEESPQCRVEAIRAASELGLVVEDELVRESVFTRMTVDFCQEVRNEAVDVLLLHGLLSSSPIGSPIGSLTKEGIKASAAMIDHIAHKEAKPFLDPELISDSDLQLVVQQMKAMGTKQNLVAQMKQLIDKDNNAMIGKARYNMTIPDTEVTGCTIPRPKKIDIVGRANVLRVEQALSII